MSTNEQLFAELIQASRNLVIVCNTASTVLSEEFESMVSGPASVVEAILDKCPEGGIAWDGTFREADVEEGSWNTGIESSRGIELKHPLSDLSVQISYAANSTPEEISRKKSVAMDVLKKRVLSYVERQRELGVLPSGS